MKRESLPVKFSFQARRVAPSVMEELGTDPSWVYEVFREGDQWVFVAYNPQEITQLLRQIGCPPEKVRKLYFAQQLVDELSSPLILNDQMALIDLDDTVALAPLSLLPDSGAKRKTLSDLKRPSQGFLFKGAKSRHWIERKELTWIATALLLLGGAWTIEGLRYHQALTKVDRTIQEAIEAHPALASQITRSNIHEKYSLIDRQQKQRRETLKKIGRLISKNSKLSMLTFDKKRYSAIIEAPQNHLGSLKKMADSLHLPAHIDGKTLRIEGRWQ
jgi:hypothetical protein